MKLQISALTASLASAAILAWPTTALALKDLVIHVDCASGNRIGNALDRPTVFDRRLVIVVNGTCTENVTIERDDVTLKAGASGGGISAADAAKPVILVSGARRIALEALSVSGGLHGVQATNGASVAIRGGSFRNASLNGAFIYNSSSATIDASSLENNGNSGIAVVNSSSATVTGSMVKGNALYGVVVSRASGVIVGNYDPMTGAVCCGNTIENNVFDGVLAADASTVHLYSNTVRGNGTANNRFGVLATRQSSILLRGGNVVHGNGGLTFGGGVFVRGSTLNTGPGDTPVVPSTNEIFGNAVGVQGASNSMIELRGGASVTGNRSHGVFADTGTTLRSEGTTISGNGGHGIVAQRDASVEMFNAPTVVTGNSGTGLSCGDPETSYSGNTSQITSNAGGDIGPLCTFY